MVTDSNELLGQVLGTCTLRRLIGRGGMGVVYVAQQSRPRRTVAVKVLMPDIVLEMRPRTEFLARFRREADAIAALDHVNIMPIYEYGEQEEIAYLVMPYVAGGTLREVLQKRSFLPLEETVAIIEQAAMALDCAHAQGIIHRDLKPGNILFHADGRALLADFGLAKVVKDITKQDTNGYSVLTSAGTIIGTPEYLSPEQSMGKTLDHRSDIYSLGIVVFQMLCGRVPFTGASPVAVAIKHSIEKPPALSQFNAAITPAVEAVVAKAMAKEPEQRYASAGELARALHDAMLATPVASVPVQHTAAEETPLADIAIDDEATSPSISIEDIHNTPTEEAPPITPITIAKPLPEYIAPLAAAQAEKPSRAVEKSYFEQIQTMPVQAEQWDHKRWRAAQGKGHQVQKRMFIGLVTALLLIFGGLLSYAYIDTLHKQARAEPKPTAMVHISSTPTRTFVGSPVIPMVPVGQLLYTAFLPGAPCDTEGGQWSSTTNAQVKCGNDATELVNTDTHRLAGVFLNALPHGTQLPSDYVIQVQVSTSANMQNQFGIFFRDQPGQQQGTYSFLLNGSGFWKASIYDNQTGTASLLYGQQATQVQLGSSITIDIVVRGNIFTFYLNRYRQGTAISGQYQQGTIGLAASTGTGVYFKNLAIYRLPA